MFLFSLSRCRNLFWIPQKRTEKNALERKRFLNCAENFTLENSYRYYQRLGYTKSTVYREKLLSWKFNFKKQLMTGVDAYSMPLSENKMKIGDILCDN